MTAATFAMVAAALFAWGVFSARLERADLTAPIAFFGVGLFISRVLSLDADVEAEIVKLVTEEPPARQPSPPDVPRRSLG